MTIKLLQNRININVLVLQINGIILPYLDGK